jgi:hypothetical protein
MHAMSEMRFPRQARDDKGISSDMRRFVIPSLSREAPEVICSIGVL